MVITIIDTNFGGKVDEKGAGEGVVPMAICISSLELTGVRLWK